MMPHSRSFLAPFCLPFVAALFLTACGDDSSNMNGPDGDSLPPGFERFASGVQVTLDGDFVVVASNGVPDHKSPYFSPTDPRYEAYNGSNPAFVLNPNRIQEQDLVFRIPGDPSEAATHQATPLGPIGVAVNGVALFNQYAGPNRPLGDEINGFDQYNGHPEMAGLYHYHTEPFYLTSTRGKDALIGFLLDGFPVYGPMENGNPITNADLDEFHGHFGATADHPGGFYHYHVTAEEPYINGAGFFGVPGTVSR